MHARFASLLQGIPWTGDVRADMAALLAAHGQRQTVDHSLLVAAEAERLAARFDGDSAPARVAGWLHDVSAVFPVEQRTQVARQLGLQVLPEEEAAPMILHQKLSAAMAREVFGVQDAAVIQAIGCHTTLRANASWLDKVLFVADKVAWDQAGSPPYLEGLLVALERSLDRAALHYLDYLWHRRHALPAVHPWLVDAYQDLRQQCQAGSQDSFLGS
jgi:predicted HD superfamily hydrolase involved in NAD metabolism